MMSAVRVDPADPTPPYEQVRRQLVALIEAGALGEGSRLPPVRQLAADLGLATGTIARAYRELEHAGLVQARRGGGTTVIRPDAHESERSRRERVEQLLTTAVRQARWYGAGNTEITDMVTRALSER